MRWFLATVRAALPREVERRISAALDAGFEGVVLEPPLYAPSYEELDRLVGPGIVRGVRLFLPYPRRLRVGQRSPFRLGSLETAERREAERHAEWTLERAEEKDVPLVLLPLAERDTASPVAGAPDGPDPDLDVMLRRRMLDSFRRSLSRLLDVADRRGRVLGLTPALEPAKLPSPAEAEACFREFEGAPLGLWLDAHSLGPDGRVMEAVAHQAAAETGTGRLLGASVCDVRGAGTGLVPGTGELDWEGLRPTLSLASIWCLDLPLRATAEDFRDSRAFLERYGSTSALDDSPRGFGI